MFGMTEDEVRRFIAGEIRAEVARQGKGAGSGAAILGKSKQAFSVQWRGIGRYRPEELLTLASWLGVDVRQFLPRGYRLMVVEAKENAEVAS